MGKHSGVEELFEDFEVEPEVVEETPTKTKTPWASLFLGFIGDLLITAGFFLGLLFVYKMYWTDVEAMQHNNTVLAELNFEVPNETPVAPEQGNGPAESSIEIGEGGVFAILHIPAFGEGYQVPIAEGTDKASILDVGMAGHYDFTQMPGELGNFGIAGHRQTHGAIFHSVPDLKDGSVVIVETADAWYVYEVDGREIVSPNDGDVLWPVPRDYTVEPTEAKLTMTTCHPMWSTKERYIVYSTLSYWIPKEAGIPMEMIQ